MSRLRRVLVAGEGGQGVQVVGEILAAAAYRAGLESLYIPNFGVEQRGGASVAYVQFSDAPIGAPKFQHADIMAVLSRRAFERTSMHQGPDTTVIYDSSDLKIPIIADKTVGIQGWETVAPEAFAGSVGSERKERAKGNRGALTAEDDGDGEGSGDDEGSSDYEGSSDDKRSRADDKRSRDDDRRSRGGNGRSLGSDDGSRDGDEVSQSDKRGESDTGPATSHKGRLLPIPASEVAKNEFTPRVLNMVVLGAIMGLAKEISEEAVMEALEAKLGSKFANDESLRELNRNAISRGKAMAQQELSSAGVQG